ncbi:Alpha/beta hydrolase family protein [Micromonospora rhizosphaerae]|uniref:Alpha/beta hydrolase family protein n=1 Tax=Micromonospora rhizosphaerae TaxID=568872 RepID=A0A1C6SB84_9ACTN|nr:acetylxylan esterase [Micromonospora rhizosphaerae]SCL26733.1 Alpha/beta hydrolase family protein [Micromonospora rhizosphaerae]
MVHRLADLRADTMPMLLPHGAAGTDWPAARLAAERVWRRYLGTLPGPVPVRHAIIAEHHEPTHVRQHLVYDAPGGEQVPALLLVPHDVLAHRRPAPAVLALHPTVGTGKADVAAPDGRANRRYGVELVERGFVVLAPDTITAGERVPYGEQPFHTASFYAGNPGWTAVGRMLVDHVQAIELLCALDVVDPNRIGAIGHSLGGYNSIFLAGLDERVRAVTASCGFSVFADDPDPGRWGERDWFSHIPRLSQDLASGEVPFEWHEIAALVAPRPMFAWCAKQDDIFPHWPAIAAGVAELARLYGVLGHPENLEFVLGDGGHDFPPPARQAAYAFLERWLGP